jgi:hypothetical protein
VDTDTSTTIALQGSVDVVPTADGGSILQGSGITVFVFFPGDAGPGDTQTGRTYLFTGNFVATSDPSGDVRKGSPTADELGPGVPVYNSQPPRSAPSRLRDPRQPAEERRPARTTIRAKTAARTR